MSSTVTSETRPLWQRPAHELARGIANRDYTAVEVMTSVLERIADVNPVINAVCTLNPDALDEARAVDRALEDGALARPLEGVPFLVKDNIDTANLKTTNGSCLQQDRVPETDEIAVRRLRDAGAILLGKTNTSEFAHDVYTTNFLFGPTRNPWQLMASPGGSSGGSGAAVAAGLAPLSLGTDFGGSVRIPASFNGIVAIRPTPGRVPLQPQEFAWDLIVSNVIGPMCATVRDAALMLDVMSGPHVSDPSARHTVPGCVGAIESAEAALREGGGVSRRRIAYIPELAPLVSPSADVRRQVDRGVERLRQLGHDIDVISIDAEPLLEIIRGTRAFGVLARFDDAYDQHADRMTTALRSQIEGARQVSMRELASAERLRSAYWRQISDLLSDYDCLLTPTCAQPPFALDVPDMDPAQRPGSRLLEVALFTYAFTVVGLPVIALPCGRTPAGLPVGMQIAGRMEQEAMLCALAAGYETANPECFERPVIDVRQAKPVAGAH